MTDTPFDWEGAPGHPGLTSFQKDAGRHASRPGSVIDDQDERMRLRLQRLERIGPDAILSAPNAVRCCAVAADALALGWDPAYVADFLARWATANEVTAVTEREGTIPHVYVDGVLQPNFMDSPMYRMFLLDRDREEWGRGVRGGTVRR